MFLDRNRRKELIILPQQLGQKVMFRNFQNGLIIDLEYTIKTLIDFAKSGYK